MVTGSLSVFNRQNSQSNIFTIFPEYPSTLFLKTVTDQEMQETLQSLLL